MDPDSDSDPDPDADPDKKSKRCHKTVEINVFRTIYAQKAQKQVDPDSDPDPEHCHRVWEKMSF
jgi:hypothetical protein